MKLDRLLGILTVLLQNKRVTAPYLAGRFEVSRRTIGRDIDALCCAGIPVITQQGSGGGISIAEGFKLDKSVLTSAELADLLAALKGIGSVSGPSQAALMLDKLGAGDGAVLSLQEPIIIDLGSHHKVSLTEKIALIKQAVLSRRMIAFDYYYEKGSVRRRIEPYFVIFQWMDWYVFGYCPLREDWRLFKLDRLWTLTLCDRAFIPRQIPVEQRHLSAHLPDDKTLVALFEPSARYKLIETYGLNCYAEQADGRLKMEIGYTNQGFIISWLLSFGADVRVLEPPELAMEVRQTAERVLARYL